MQSHDTEGIIEPNPRAAMAKVERLRGLADVKE
jgi:hypothetical protein